MNTVTYSAADIAAAIEAEADAWARFFSIHDEADKEHRRRCMRGNVAVGYLDPLREYLPALETLSAPGFVVERTSARYGDCDELIGTVSRVVDCARTERHALLIARRLGRGSDGEVYYRVFHAEDASGHRYPILPPVIPSFRPDADLPF